MYAQAQLVRVVIQEANQVIGQLRIAKHLAGSHCTGIARTDNQGWPIARGFSLGPRRSWALDLLPPTGHETHATNHQQRQHGVDDYHRARKAGHKGRFRPEPQHQDEDCAQQGAQSHSPHHGQELSDAGVTPEPAI